MSIDQCRQASGLLYSGDLPSTEVADHKPPFRIPRQPSGRVEISQTLGDPVAIGVDKDRCAP